MEVLDPDVAARVELLDLGCGSGRSLVSAERCSGIGGIGLDRDPAKVACARRAGLPAFQADVLDLRPSEGSPVRAVTFDRPVSVAFDVLLVAGPEVPGLRYRGAPGSSAARPLVASSDRRAPTRPTADRHRRRPSARVASSRAHAAGSVVRRSH